MAFIAIALLSGADSASVFILFPALRDVDRFPERPEDP